MGRNGGGETAQGPASAAPPPRGLGFLLLYAMAWGGGVIAYVPLLTLILPVKVAAIAPDHKVALLSVITLIGAVVASLINIGVGMISDRTVLRSRGRRPWIALGLVLTVGSYAVLYASTTPTGLVLGVVAFQVALNLMLAPLSATAADEIPDDQKGLIGGMMGAVYPLGGVAGIVITASPSFTGAIQFCIVAGLVVIGVSPLLLSSRTRGPIVPASAPALAAGPERRRNLARVWTARLLIQIAGSIFFAYLMFFFETVDRSTLGFGPADLAGQVAWLSGGVTVVVLPLAIVAGRLSDRLRSRKPFMVLAAIMITASLLIMAMLPHWAAVAVGYLLFSCGVAIFLALQGAYAMQLMITPQHRGRDMGVLNLTNTLPALIAPALAWLMAGAGDFTALLLVLAVLTGLAAVLVVQIRDEPEPGAGLSS